MIYLDNSSTTRILPNVVEKMLPYLKESFGNPSSKYYSLAEEAKLAIEIAKSNVSALLNAEADEITFNSGATEGNNFVLKGIAFDHRSQGKHIITTEIEHKSVLETCSFLESIGYEVTYLPVDSEGSVTVNNLKKALRTDTILVSIMFGNNEIGSLNNIEELCDAVKEFNSSVFFHTDATQVIGKVKIDVKSIAVDSITMSAHKIYGPKGVGAVYLRKNNLGLTKKITPLLHGGSQEGNLRAGTHSVHNIVGLGEAARLAKEEVNSRLEHLTILENHLIEQLKKINGLKFNSPSKNKIPGIVNICLPGLSNELLIRSLKKDVAISTGSACSINEPSYVLSAIGVPLADIRCSIRISLSIYNKVEDINLFISQLKSQINTLLI